MALFAITLLGIIAAPVLIYISAPGFSTDPGKGSATVESLQITFVYILCISPVALACVLLNTYSYFSIPAFTRVLLNLSFIGCALWLAPVMDTPVLALAWAVFIGGILQLALQIPFLLHLKKMPRLRFNFRNSGAW